MVEGGKDHEFKKLFPKDIFSVQINNKKLIIGMSIGKREEYTLDQNICSNLKR